MPDTRRSAAARSAAAKPPRVRRGNLEDQSALREQVVKVAFEIFRREGMQALTMRAVAAEVGVSAMALYRYFASKADLLRGLWDFVLVELRAQLAAAEPAQATPLERTRANVDAFMRYWEEHPDHYRLVYATPQALTAGGEDANWTVTPVYLEMLDASQRRMRELAQSLGGDPRQARMARDTMHCLMQGYLYSAIVNARYPWMDLPQLREQVVETIIQAVLRCLRAEARAGAKAGTAGR